MKELINIQNNIVQAVALSADGRWTRLMVNIEIESANTAPVLDCLAVSFDIVGGRTQEHSFKIPPKCNDLFLELKQKQDNWSSCTLEIDSNGKYRFSYSFDKPKRLNGDFSDEAQLLHYDPANPL